MYHCEQWRYSFSCGCPGHWGYGDDVFQRGCSDGAAVADWGSNLRQFVDQYLVVFIYYVDVGSLIFTFCAGVHREFNWDVCFFVHVGWEHSYVV